VTTLYLGASAGDEEVDLLGRYEPLLAYAVGLVEYCGEAEAHAAQLLRMVEYRHVIEQAKGMVMTRRQVGADEAFALLVETSQRANVKLRTLCIALVQGVSAGPAAEPRRLRAEPVPAEARRAAEAMWSALTAGGTS
jgi:hypothetical protein